MDRVEFKLKTKLKDILDMKRMKRGMGTRLAIIVLGLLAKKDMHGYEILKSMDFLVEKPSYSQLYPLLNKLEKKGLVKGKWKGRKKVYSLTKEGKKATKESKEIFKKTMLYMEYIYKKVY